MASPMYASGVWCSRNHVPAISLKFSPPLPFFLPPGELVRRSAHRNNKYGHAHSIFDAKGLLQTPKSKTSPNAASAKLPSAWAVYVGNSVRLNQIGDPPTSLHLNIKAERSTRWAISVFVRYVHVCSAPVCWSRVRCPRLLVSHTSAVCDRVTSAERGVCATGNQRFSQTRQDTTT